METRQRDHEKDKEKEKTPAPEERTPKVSDALHGSSSFTRLSPDCCDGSIVLEASFLSNLCIHLTSSLFWSSLWVQTRGGKPLPQLGWRDSSMAVV